MLDKLGRFMFVNKKTLEITGYKEEELIGKHFNKLVPMKYLPKCLDMFQRQLRNMKPEMFEIEVRTKKDKLVPIEINGLAVKEEGKIVGVQVVARDITGRKKVEEEMKESKDELQSKVEELERFTKLAVGRELKMIELKKKIKELEEKLKKSKLQ